VAVLGAGGSAQVELVSCQVEGAPGRANETVWGTKRDTAAEAEAGAAP
jgi:hypothetical protein